MQVVAIDPAFGGSTGGTVVTLYGKFNADNESREGVSFLVDLKALLMSSA
jgi:hypothetical protein